MDFKKRAQQLKRDIPTVFLVMKDQDTPLNCKILGLIIVVYALSPIDLIPDFIPILGYLDDLIILPLLIILFIKLIPKPIWLKNQQLAQGIWDNGKPKKWYYAIPFIIVWLLFLIIIIKLIWFN